MPFDPAYFGLAVPFLLLVLWYFERKRQRERRRDGEILAQEIAAAVPSRRLETLLFGSGDEGEPTRGESLDAAAAFRKLERLRLLANDNEPEPARAECDAAEPGREPVKLLRGGDDEAEPTRGESFRNFLRGAPTRKLTLDWFVGLYHGLVGFGGIAALAILVIRDAVKNPAFRNVLVAMVSAVALGAWAWRIHADRRREEIEARLRQVLLAHGLVCAAVVDSYWKVRATAGDFAALSSDLLPRALLGSHGTAMTMYRALSEMPVPQVIAAGLDVAIADKPDKDTAVVAFTRGFGAGANLEAIAANVSATIRAEFAPHRRPTPGTP